MKANELDLKKDGFLFNTKTRPARSHYKFIMKMGGILPETKAQAKFFVSNGICLDVLNFDDVLNIEQILNRHGFLGNYVYTKSKRWVRLVNNSDLNLALKLEFQL